MNVTNIKQWNLCSTWHKAEMIECWSLFKRGHSLKAPGWISMRKSCVQFFSHQGRNISVWGRFSFKHKKMCLPGFRWTWPRNWMLQFWETPRADLIWDLRQMLPLAVALKSLLFPFSGRCWRYSLYWELFFYLNMQIVVICASCPVVPFRFLWPQCWWK